MSAISTKIYAKDSSGTLRELQPETTISNVSGLQTALDGKVDTVSGKGLSTNDYTTTEKNKLAGIANNANNYVHPTTSGNKHIPSGGSSGKILGWSADGTAAWVDSTGGETFIISRYSSSYTVDTETWKSNGMAWFTILIKNSNQINANTSTIPAYVPSDLKPKGSRDINLVCDVDNKYCRAWITGGSQYIYLRPTENIPANSNIRITGSYPY